MSRFDVPVDRVSVAGAAATGHTVTFPKTTVAEAVAIAAAVRPWERLGAPVRVNWFPRSKRPVVLVSPGPEVRAKPLAPIRLTFSEPVRRLFAGRRPTVVPTAAGRWLALDDHTLVFQPSGSGLPFNSQVAVRLPSALLIASETGAHTHVSTSVRVSIAPCVVSASAATACPGGLLAACLAAGEGGGCRGETMRGELAAAVDPPAGHFGWKYSTARTSSRHSGRPAKRDEITRGAVMMFQDEHHLAVDGIAGPQVWHALLSDAVAGARRTRRLPASSASVETSRNC